MSGKGRPRGSKNRTYGAKEPNETYIKSVAFRLPITKRSPKSKAVQARLHRAQIRQEAERKQHQPLPLIPLRSDELRGSTSGPEMEGSERYFQTREFSRPIHRSLNPPGSKRKLDVHGRQRPLAQDVLPLERITPSNTHTRRGQPHTESQQKQSEEYMRSDAFRLPIRKDDI